MADETDGKYTPPSRAPFGSRSQDERRLPLGAGRTPRTPPPEDDQSDHLRPYQKFRSLPDFLEEMQREAPPETPEAAPPPAADDISAALAEGYFADLPQPEPAPPAPEAPDLPADSSAERSFRDQVEDLIAAGVLAEMEAEAEEHPQQAPPPRRSMLKRPVSTQRSAPRPQPAAAPVGAPSITATAIDVMVLGRSWAVMMVGAVFVATIFTWWSPNAFLPEHSLDQLSVALATQAAPAQDAPVLAAAAQPSATPTLNPELNRIGIVSGHRGIHPASGLPDPGAVCEDGLTEREVNEAVATRVVTLLSESGYQVDLLDEFDERLRGYRALTLVSIHADSCQFVGEGATGYKVAGFEYAANPAQSERLVRCLHYHYEQISGLPFHPSITYDMTRYHTFREIDPGTPGAILELGFMFADREMLTSQPDALALGVARGILCYLRGEEPTVEGLEEAGAVPVQPPTEAPAPQ